MAGKITVSTINDSSGVLATQNGMTGIAKAWVNYNGQTPAINGSFNVSSVTYVGLGKYTINFTTVMANANYATVGTSSTDSNSADYATIITTGDPSNNYGIYTTAGVRINARSQNGAAFINPTILSVAILGS
jgi:hypothetical protein